MNRAVQGPRGSTAYAEGVFFSLADYSQLIIHTGKTLVPVSALPSNSDAKTELRRKLRAQRRAVDPQAACHAAEQLARRLSETAIFRASRRIGCYLPADGEIDTAQVIERIQALNKRCFLPVLSCINHDRLWFAPCDAQTRYRRNRYQIPEPVVLPRQMVRAPKLDLILLPLVGFDAAGNRLGMGAGFYDRSLAFLAHRKVWHKPHLMGLAYEFQKTAAIPHAAWDIPLDAVVTEQMIYVVKSVQE